MADEIREREVKSSRANSEKCCIDFDLFKLPQDGITRKVMYSIYCRQFIVNCKAADRFELFKPLNGETDCEVFVCISVR